jgi:hypothetical protein
MTKENTFAFKKAQARIHEPGLFRYFMKLPNQRTSAAVVISAGRTSAGSASGTRSDRSRVRGIVAVGYGERAAIEVLKRRDGSFGGLYDGRVVDSHSGDGRRIDFIDLAGTAAAAIVTAGAKIISDDRIGVEIGAILIAERNVRRQNVLTEVIAGHQYMLTRIVAVVINCGNRRTEKSVRGTDSDRVIGIKMILTGTAHLQFYGARRIADSYDFADEYQMMTRLRHPGKDERR